MREKNTVCAVIGCVEKAAWAVNMSSRSGGPAFEVPVCKEHNREIATNAPVIREEAPDA